MLALAQVAVMQYAVQCDAAPGGQESGCQDPAGATGRCRFLVDVQHC